MGSPKYIGHVGALAAALGIASAVVTTGTAPVTETIGSPPVKLAADTTALLLCGTACPKWNDAHVALIENQFIAPTQPPGKDIDYVAVTTPSEAWPLNGVFRLMGLLGLGEPGCAKPGGDCWPDVPL